MLSCRLRLDDVGDEEADDEQEDDNDDDEADVEPDEDSPDDEDCESERVFFFARRPTRRLTIIKLLVIMFFRIKFIFLMTVCTKAV